MSKLPVAPFYEQYIGGFTENCANSHPWLEAKKDDLKSGEPLAFWPPLSVQWAIGQQQTANSIGANWGHGHSVS